MLNSSWPLRAAAFAAAVSLCPACTGGDEGKPKASATPSRSGGPAVTACNLLTDDEVKTTMRRPLGRKHAGPTRASNLCYFELRRAEQLVLAAYTTGADVVYEAGGVGVPVADLGEKAKWIEESRTLVAYQDGATLTLALLVFNGARFDELLPMGTKLLQLALPRA